MPEHTFRVIKGRYLVAVWFLLLVYPPGANFILNTIGETWPWYWWSVFYYYYIELFLIATALILCYFGRLSCRSFIGRRIIKKDLIPGLKLTFFIILFSIATSYMLFYPLSFYSPEFVQWWFIDPASIIYSDGESYPIAANLLGFISLVVIAPVIEEVIFRGLLLHRWYHKWGLTGSVLLSSLIFGIVHPDPVGAVAFGIGMCILYLRTQTLLIPIICHAINNLFAWLLEAAYRSIEGHQYRYTLDDFQSEWYVGVICGVIVIFWSYRFINRPSDLREWKLPTI